MDKYFKIKDQVNGYSVIKLIGEGRFGIVYLGKNKRSDICVIKQLKKDMIEESKKKLFYEVEILKELDNSCFPKFISKFKDKYRQGYILEYIEGIVFEDLIRKNNYVFSKKQIYEIADELLNIIELLQNKNIVHRDIRLPNVILKEDNTLALIDFGLARYIDNKNYFKEMDYWYLADFLIHLYYTSYTNTNHVEKPWYEELDLNNKEKKFLKKLMGIDKNYKSIEDIKYDLNLLKI